MRKCLDQTGVRRAEIGPVHLHAAQAGKAGSKLVCVHGAHFAASGRNTPVVVLHQVHDGQLVQNGHLQCLSYFTLGHGPVANRAQHQWLHLGGVVTRQLRVARNHQTLALKIGQRVRHPGGRNGLHAGGRALVRHHRRAGPAQRGVRIVGAAAAEGVVGLGQQLQHQLVGAQAQAQQQGVVAVVRGGVVGFGEQEGGGQLHGFVAPSGGVHVARGHRFFFFVQGRHLGGSVHQAVSALE